MSSVKDYHSEFSNNITVTVAKLSYSDTSGCQVGSTTSQTAEGWRMRDREVSVIHTKNPVVHFKLRQAAKHFHLWRAAGRRRGTYWKKHQCVCCRWREWNIRSGRSGGDVKRTRSKQAELFVNHVWGRCSTCKHITLTSNQTNYMVLKRKTYYTFVQYGAQAQRCHEIKWKVEPKEM